MSRESSGRGYKVQRRTDKKIERTFQFNDFDGEVLLSHAEDFKVTEGRLFRLGMSIYLDAQEIALVLPIQFALQCVASISFAVFAGGSKHNGAGVRGTDWE